MEPPPDLQAQREKYASQYSSLPKRALLEQLVDETYASCARPHMISGPVQGSFLYSICLAIQAKSVLEIGTFTAYSTICLAAALGESDRMVTLEKDERLAPIINKYIQKAELGCSVELIFGDAADWLRDNHSLFDLIFIDAAKKQYGMYLEYSLKCLSTNGMILIDNTLFKNEVLSEVPKSKIATYMKHFNDLLCQRSDIVVTMIPIRDGMTMIQKSQ